MLSLCISIAAVIALHISKSGAITNLIEMVCRYFNSPQFVLSSVYTVCRICKVYQTYAEALTLTFLIGNKCLCYKD